MGSGLHCPTPLHSSSRGGKAVWAGRSRSAGRCCREVLQCGSDIRTSLRTFVISPCLHTLIHIPVYDGGITGCGTITVLQTKHYVRRKTKQAGKQDASLRHLANGLLAANISGVESWAPAARWEKAGFQTVTNGEKAQPASLR